jgi:hypothetical protein
MYISSVRINNYKSFNQSSILELKQGFNIIVGKNNAGKTALIEVLSTQFQPKPHRSSKTAPKGNSPINTISSVDVAFTVDHDELIGILQDVNSPFNIPIPTDIQPDKNNYQIAKYARQVLSQSAITFRLQVQSGGGLLPTHFPSYEERPVHGSPGHRRFAQCRFQDGRVEVEEQDLKGSEQNEFGFQIAARHLSSRIYCFRAERMLIARCAVGANTALKPNAENLAEVLHNLQANTYRFSRFNDYVRQVLPDVTQVTARNLGNNHVEVSVGWSCFSGHQC